jgi:hypothetical protein
MRIISSFTACKRPPTLLKANPETGIHPFQKHLAVSWPARCSVEKISFNSTAGGFIAWAKAGAAAPKRLWFAAPGPQDAAGISNEKVMN